MRSRAIRSNVLRARAVRPGLVAVAAAVLAASAMRGPASDGDVTIQRDEWGVPHIYAPTDASVVFGAAYAQAEDNWAQVAENFLRATGRGAEILGEEALLDDYLARALEIPRRSMEEYERAPAQMRALYDAYAAGFNHWRATHPDAGPEGEDGRPLLPRVEPWHTLALIRFKYHHNEYLGYAGLDRDEMVRWFERARVEPEEGASGPGLSTPSVSSPTSSFLASASATGSSSPSYSSLAFDRALSPDGTSATGSNEWALAGSRTASGAPMLLINPHVSFFGLSQYTEAHLHSDEGLVFSGLTRFGFMLPYMGNSDVLGWAYTDNYGDYNDLYWLTLDEEDGAHRYGDGWRELRRWTERIVVAPRAGDGRARTGVGGEPDTDRGEEEGAGPERRTYRFAASHHGPIVGIDDEGRPLAARLSKLDEGGWFEQWYAMMRARSHEEWLAAVARLNVPYMNTMYADRDGNIHYIYNHAVPRRSTAYDWSEPVDGSDPGAEWDGYHGLDELPQVVNPASGWLQNTNSDPLRAAPDAGLRRKDFPRYMIGSESQNARAVSSVRVLEGLHGITLDDFARAVLDTRLSAVDELLPPLLEDLREGFDRLEGPARVLREWDGRTSVESVAATLFARWAEEMGRRPGSAGADRVGALEKVIAALERDWGTWEVPWGEVNRI
ncbi:MAG: penicillin acylase family protein, partial [Gemmatimonadota bacterium]